MAYDWYTQRYSPRRRHALAAWLSTVKAVVDCIIGQSASFLVEPHAGPPASRGACAIAPPPAC